MLAYISWKVVTAFHVGPFMIRSHGLLIALGFLAGARLMQRYTRPWGIDDEVLWRVLGWGLVAGALLGCGSPGSWVTDPISGPHGRRSPSGTGG